MSISAQAITFSNTDEFPSGIPVTMDENGIHIETEDLSFTSLMQLPVVLGGLGIPDNEYTLKVRDTVYIEEKNPASGNPNTVTIGNYNQTMVNTTYGNTIELNNDSIQQWIKVTEGQSGNYHEIQASTEITYAAVGPVNVTYSAAEATDKSIHMTCSAPQTTVTLNDGVTSYTQLWPDKLKISDGYTTQGLTEISMKTISQNNVFTGENITISTEGDATISLTKDGIGTAQLKGEGTCLRLDSCANVDLKLNSNTAKTFIGDTDAVGNNTVIMVDDVLRCTSFRSGMMNRTLEIFSADLAIRPQYTFVTTNGYDCTLRSPTDYYNPFTTNGDGWYCYVFNNSAVDHTLSNMGDYQMYVHPTGPSSNITIKKFATVRVTLVYAADNYIWSVSMF